MSDISAVIEAFLDEAGIAWKRSDAGAWLFELHGERKLSIAVSLSVAGSRLQVESFFMRRPRENLASFYELLLRRNVRTYGVHFAVDTDGDVFLVGQRPLAGFDDAEMDRLVGSILTEADGMFDPAIKIGFATYLDADMAWRAKNAPSP